VFKNTRKYHFEKLRTSLKYLKKKQQQKTKKR